jgi:hypothetical protein
MSRFTIISQAGSVGVINGVGGASTVSGASGRLDPLGARDPQRIADRFLETQGDSSRYFSRSPEPRSSAARTPERSPSLASSRLHDC